MAERANKIYGIDLGTTYSCIAHLNEHGKAEVITNSEGERITPSAVFFESDNDIIVGSSAKSYAVANPNDTITFVKRHMGKGTFTYFRGDKLITAEEISSHIIRKLVQDTELQTGEKITDVVITCPAYFGIEARQATKYAGEIAGLTVHQIVNEPTAAAIAYGFGDAEGKSSDVLIYDLGGGTFDVTLISIKPDCIEVVCTDGDHELGGKDWDDAIVRYMVDQFREETGITDDILSDAETAQELQLAAENIKKNLSKIKKASGFVNFDGNRVKVELTREKFEELTSHLLEQTINQVKNVLETAKKKGVSSFDKFLLVGGSTRMAQIIERIQKEFGIEPEMYDPDEAVAKGAAIFGNNLLIRNKVIETIAAQTGQAVEDVKNNVESGAVSEEQLQLASNKVANDLGLSLPAVKKAQNTKIINVCSKSFGVVAVDGSSGKELVFNLILRNDPVPASATQTFGTMEANQGSVLLRVMENVDDGNRLQLEAATEIGQAELELPSGLPSGSPIEVTYALSSDGLLSLYAIEKNKNREVKATFQTTCSLSQDELKDALQRSKSITIS